MKKPHIIIGFAVVALLFAVVLSVLSALTKSSWKVNATANINQAAASVQIYKREYGQYPQIMEAAFEWGNTARDKELAKLPGCPDSHYELNVLSNGFALSVVRLPGLLRKEWRVTEEFVDGKAVFDNNAVTDKQREK